MLVVKGVSKMKTRPKRFRCVQCRKETYHDYNICSCGATWSYKPIKQQHYHLYLNDHFYGVGNFAYVKELITDYLIANDMYGQNEVVFKIVKAKDEDESFHI
jgi:hypothetical protein